MNLIGTVLLLPVVIVPVQSASAETCQGRPATVVGAYDASLTGTEADDVIVTNGATAVRALGGADMICVTGRPSKVSVDAGPGDDVVDAGAAPPTGAYAVLGPGADRYLGSIAPDWVVAGGLDHEDSEPDSIDLSPYGGPSDVVVTGRPGAANSDQVVMSGGRLEWSGIATAQASVLGGPATQLWLAESRPRSVSIDAAAGTAVVDDVHRLAFRGIARFHLETSRAPHDLSYVGGAYRDELDLVMSEFPRDARHMVDLGPGNDELRLESFGPVPAGVTFDAGPGRHDRLALSMADDRRVTVDLGREQLTVQKGPKVVTATVRGFEDLDVLTQHAVLVGSAEDNILRAHACRLDARGGPGRDQLGWVGQGSRYELMCLGRRARLSGDGGRDHLTGSPGDDVLDGGRGVDWADGRAGRDSCRVEVRRRCEVRG